MHYQAMTNFAPVLDEVVAVVGLLGAQVSQFDIDRTDAAS
jgi:hypothetical protein